MNKSIDTFLLRRISEAAARRPVSGRPPASMPAVRPATPAGSQRGSGSSD